jgi:catechol 2,3-dioxygenase-like lactoylglutathione lyase family enzyme
MIDHISISVRDLTQSTSFYHTVLATIGFDTLVERQDTTGFGKKYPEFWLNLRSQMERVGEDSGVHIALRATSKESVDRFYEAALQAGAQSDGGPGFRPEYHDSYYAAFIRDPDGNRIEVVTFVTDKD